MIIIKKENAYSYYLGALECNCQQISISDDDIPFCDVIFKINRDQLHTTKPVLSHILTIFSQLCSEKHYFIPHFYFRVKDILLINENKEESLLYEQDYITLQKLNDHFFFTGNPLHWQQQIKKIFV